MTPNQSSELFALVNLLNLRRRTALVGGSHRQAVFDSTERYRYFLCCVHKPDKPLVAFCMLNPSTADEHKNDPTVERVNERALRMGYGGWIVVNAFALRSTDPQGLYNDTRPIGEANDVFLAFAARTAALTICAWGKHANYLNRGAAVLKQLAQHCTPHALKINKDGSPAHPLYLPYSAAPRPMAHA